MSILDAGPIDDASLRVINLAKDGWGIEDIAVDADRDEMWVIETLFQHRDFFRPEIEN